MIQEEESHGKTQHTGRTACGDGGRDWGDVYASQGTPRVAASPEAGEKHGQMPPWQEPSSDTLIGDFWLPDGEGNKFLLFEATQFAVLHNSSPKKRIHHL